MTIRRSSFLAIFFVTLTACATQQAYDGPIRSGDEVATVRAYGVTIRSVNDKKIESSSAAVAILPGQQKIAVTPNASNYGMLSNKDAKLYINMKAEAGKSYAITSKRGFRKLCAYECTAGTSKPDFSLPAGCAVHASLIEGTE